MSSCADLRSSEWPDFVGIWLDTCVVTHSGFGSCVVIDALVYDLPQQYSRLCERRGGATGVGQ